MPDFIQCAECQDHFKDTKIWWSGYFWFCFECVIHLENEHTLDNGRDECSCHQDEINIHCQGCF